MLTSKITSHSSSYLLLLFFPLSMCCSHICCNIHNHAKSFALTMSDNFITEHVLGCVFREFLQGVFPDYYEGERIPTREGAALMTFRAPPKHLSGCAALMDQLCHQVRACSLFSLSLIPIAE